MSTQTYDIFKKRKHVIEYHKDKIPNKETITDALWHAWHCTPSKQNYYPYTVNILGPGKEFDDEKLKVWDKAMINHHDVEVRAHEKKQLKETKFKVNRTYQHLSDAPYVIVFTSRTVDPEKTNDWNKKCIAEDGHFSEPEFSDQHETLAQATSIEVGLFAASLTGILVEQGIDITYTTCFPKRVEKWHDVPFVNTIPLLTCSIGYGKYYKKQWMQENGPDIENGRSNWDMDRKADFEDIINWVKDTPGTTDENRTELKRRVQLAIDGKGQSPYEAVNG